jgi:hypothetical protein
LNNGEPQAPQGTQATPADKPRKLRTPLGGFLILLAIDASAAGLGLIFLFLMLGLAFSGGSSTPAVGAFIIPTVIISCLVPFLMGRIVGDRNGWMAGLSYALVMLFVMLPIVAGYVDSNGKYIWFRSSGLFIAIYLTVALGLTLGFSLLGSIETKRRSRIKMEFASTFRSAGMLLITSVCLALLGPLILTGVYRPEQASPARIVKVPQYNLQILKPEGWIDPTHPGVSKFKTWQKNAEAQVELITEPSMDLDKPRGSVNIYIFSKMPFTGEPLSNYDSAEQVYAALQKTFLNLSARKYVNQYHFLNYWEYRFYGTVSVDNIQGIRIGLEEREVAANETAPAPLPATSAYGDVIVYKKPYLYWFEMGVGQPLRSEILKSVKFTD